MGRTIADWYQEYSGLVIRRCRKMLRNEHDAEEAAQDVFLNLLKAEGRGMDLINARDDKSLLYTISTNVCLNKLNERKRKQGKDFLYEEGIYEAANDFQKLDAKILIEAILKDESDETKTYCYMYYFDGMKLKEIAETAGKSKSWVHKKLEEFRKHTRQKLAVNL